MTIPSGFTGRRIPLIRRRTLTALPSLVILALPVSAGQALLYSQVVLSFGIPFALFPLLIITRDAGFMGAHASGRVTNWLLAAAAVIITGLNLDPIGQLIAGAL